MTINRYPLASYLNGMEDVKLNIENHLLSCHPRMSLAEAPVQTSPGFPLQP
jgi:hypothetical protein